MPLPSVVAMTVPHSPATLSRLLLAGSSQAKPELPGCSSGSAAQSFQQLLALILGWQNFPPAAGEEMCWDTVSCNVMVVVHDPAQEKGYTALRHPTTQELLSSFLLFLSFFYLFLFLAIFLLSFPFSFPSFPFPISLFISLFSFLAATVPHPVLNTRRPV